MTRKRPKRKPPKRRSPVAAALRSPAFRKRVVPNKKRRAILDIEARSEQGVCLLLLCDDGRLHDVMAMHL